MNSTFKNKRRYRPEQRNNKFAGAQRRPQRQRSGRKPSTLDPNLLVKKAIITEEEQFRSERRIEDMPLSTVLKLNLAKKGYERPTEIQDRTLETLLQGRDILGIAQTGTGKTGAFLMPIIEQLLQRKGNQPYALVIVPTRELALQIAEEFRSMTKDMHLYSACFIGGTNINRDLQTLRRPSHVIIGTPGRLLDLNERKALDFKNFHTLVLDEFDRMLDMGFSRDMDRIIGSMHNRKHTMLFSATLNKSQQGKINQILNNPVSVKVSMGDTSGDQIEQEIIRLGEEEDQFKTLCDMLNQHEFTKVLLFDETKHRVSRLCKKLNKAGIKSDQIQGNKSQNARQSALKAFKQGRVKVLVATDVAARGLDVSDISHVINYQMPMTYDGYIHRIGRTGRAGKVGKAYTFVCYN